MAKRRKSRSRRKNAGFSRVRRRAAALKGWRRRSRSRNRRRSRNSWVNNAAGHAAAAKKGWRHRRRKSKRTWAQKMWAARTGAVPVRGRRRRKAANRGRRKHYRRHRRNPSTPIKALLSGFSKNSLMDAATIAAGMVAQPQVKKLVVGALPLGAFFEDEDQIGSVVTGIALAGLLGFGVGMVNKQIGTKVALGGVLAEVQRAVNKWVLPAVGLKMSGLEDYLSVGDAAGARSLGDYLSIGDAAGARPLGDMVIGEELAGM